MSKNLKTDFVISKLEKIGFKKISSEVRSEICDDCSHLNWEDYKEIDIEFDTYVKEYDGIIVTLYEKSQGMSPSTIRSKFRVCIELKRYVSDDKSCYLSMYEEMSIRGVSSLDWRLNGYSKECCKWRKKK